MKKRGLGRGLEALLGDQADQHKPKDTVTLLPLNQLVANPYQPRKTFDESEIQALSNSIKQHGIIQPLAVRPLKENKYEIIAGERRFRAAKLAGLSEVPVIIHNVSDADSAVFALIENIQREDLNAIEKAKGIKSLIDEFDLTHERCGKLLGQSRSSVSNHLRLLDLSDAVQDAVIGKKIDMGHARTLINLEKDLQESLLNQVTLYGLSVRETEDLVKKQQGQLPSKRNRKSDKVKQEERALGLLFNAKVSILQKKSGEGKISIEYTDLASFEMLLEQLKN